MIFLRYYHSRHTCLATEKINSFELNKFSAKINLRKIYENLNPRNKSSRKLICWGMSKEAKKVWNHNFNYDPCITLSVHTHSSFLIETFVETFERFVLIMLYVVLHKVISFCFVLSQVFVIFYIWFHWLFFWFIFFFFIINASYAKIRFFSHYSQCLQSYMRRRSFS